jgi:hypothetical protein
MNVHEKLLRRKIWVGMNGSEGIKSDAGIGRIVEEALQ